MVAPPLLQKRGSSPSAVSPNLVLSRNPERKKKERKNHPFQNENQEFSNCLFWYYLPKVQNHVDAERCWCAEEILLYTGGNIWAGKKEMKDIEKVLSLSNLETFQSNNAIIYLRCSKLTYSPLSLTWMFYKQSQVIVIKAKRIKVKKVKSTCL